MSDSFCRAGIVGAGIIGGGLAHTLAEYGLNVVLIDKDQDALQKSRQEIVRSAGLRRMLKKTTVKSEEILGKISFSTAYEDLATSQFVLECVSEDTELKRRVWEKIGQACPQKPFMASTTSAIPITRLASFCPCPQRFVGMHFMNPVPLTGMVEVIQGFHTSPETVQAAMDLCTQVGKTGKLVQDSPGFVTNRVLMLTVNEAIFLLQDRVAEAKTIDEIFKGCFGHKMGPLETADMIGLDTILQSLQVLQESFGDPKYRPAPLLRQMVDAGLLGRKSGKGFYKY